MKLLTITQEQRAYSEQEARDFVDTFRKEAAKEGYTVKSAGWSYKAKKKKGEVVAEAWITKCVAVYDEIWDEMEGEEQ
jgi:hypothetical protein